jgi:hypothetical protein
MRCINCLPKFIATLVAGNTSSDYSARRFEALQRPGLKVAIFICIAVRPTLSIPN